MYLARMQDIGGVRVQAWIHLGKHIGMFDGKDDEEFAEPLKIDFIRVEVVDGRRVETPYAVGTLNKKPASEND